MRHRLVTLTRPFHLDVAGSDEAPAELVVFAAGIVRTTKYLPFVMDEVGAKRCIAAFQALGRDLPVDYEHQTLGGVCSSPDGTAPAAGWVKALSWDPARGLIAAVEWTDRAKEFIKTRQYRYFSPVGVTEPATKTSPSRFVELFHMALTNDPATIDIEPIAASRRAAGWRTITAQGGNPVDQVLQLLGLDATATFEDLMAAVTDDNVTDLAAFLGVEATREAVLAEIKRLMFGEEKTEPTVEPPPTEPPVESIPLKRLTEKLGLKDLKGEDNVIAAIRGKLTGQVDLKKRADATHDQLVAANERIEALELVNSRQAFDSLCDTEHKGKVPPADADEYFELFCSARKTFDTVMKSMATIADGKSIMDARAASETKVDDKRHPWDKKIEEVVASGKAKNKLAAIAILKRQEPQLFEDYRDSQTVTGK